MGFDDLPDDVKAQAEARGIAARSDTLKPLENVRLHFGRDSDSMIPDRKPETARALIGAQGDFDRLASTVLDGVGKEVGDHLFDPGGVPDSKDGPFRPERDLTAALSG